jgi:hypothetical protein
MSEPIDVTNGRVEYRGGTVTDKAGKDITGATFQVALGTSLTDEPTTGWGAPDVNDPGAGTVLQDGTAIPGTAQRILKKLVGPPTPPGSWYLWWSYVDNPENGARVFPDRIITK